MRGGRLSRQRVAEIVRDAAEHASDVLSARGLPPLPHTTPPPAHISIALLANRFDVLWVMGQVGHADSKMTMDVYAQLQQRVLPARRRSRVRNTAIGLLGQSTGRVRRRGSGNSAAGRHGDARSHRPHGGRRGQRPQRHER